MCVELRRVYYGGSLRRQRKEDDHREAVVRPRSIPSVVRRTGTTVRFWAVMRRRLIQKYKQNEMKFVARTVTNLKRLAARTEGVMTEMVMV